MRDKFTEAHNQFVTTMQSFAGTPAQMQEALQPSLNQMGQAFYESPPNVRMGLRFEMIEAAQSARDYNLKPRIRLNVSDVTRSAPMPSEGPTAQLG